MRPITFFYWSSPMRPAYNSSQSPGCHVCARQGCSDAPRSYARRPMEPTPQSEQTVPVEAPLEDLGLSVRARNALKGVGCNTIADVLRLDLERPVRGLGRLAREELLAKLECAGIPHPSEARPGNDIALLEHSLERLEHR